MKMLIQLIGVILAINLLFLYPQCSGATPNCDEQVDYLKQIEDLKKTITDLRKAKQLLEIRNQNCGDLNTYTTTEFKQNMKQVTQNIGGTVTAVELSKTTPTLPLLFASVGTLLDAGQKVKLNEFYGVPNQQWKLLYKASRDGFSASTFHKLCDDKGATMTIIKSSGGWLFGGYTTQSWTDPGRVFKDDSQAFIFTLTNPHNIPSSKFIIKNDKQHQAIKSGFETWGPIFGNDDFFISDKSNNNDLSGVYFPRSYKDTTGKGSTLFTGSQRFTTADIEVYAIMK